MIFNIEDDVTKKAKTPHELFMLNLVAFHLLAAPASIVLEIGLMGFLIPLGLSLSFIGFLWLKNIYGLSQQHWFVQLHWRLSAKRTLILLVGYAITASILLFAFLVTSGSDKSDIMMVALSRVAAVPTLITVMVCFVLESSAIYQAGRGEISNGLVKRYPPPEGVVAQEG